MEQLTQGVRCPVSIEPTCPDAILLMVQVMAYRFDGLYFNLWCDCVIKRTASGCPVIVRKQVAAGSPKEVCIYKIHTYTDT